MELILVINDTRGKNILFISDSLKAFTLSEAIQLVQAKQLSALQIVRSMRGGFYLRTKPGSKPTLNELSVSIQSTTKALREFIPFCKLEQVKHYIQYRMDHAEPDTIVIDGVPRKSKNEVIAHLKQYKPFIVKAAQTQKIDPVILGSILIDEYLRMGVDDLGDWLGILGVNTSVGIAQIQMKTAEDIIRAKLYIPDNDSSLIHNRPKLYEILNMPQHSVNFCAARIRQIINYWVKALDISNRIEILGTLYSKGLGVPKINPGPSDRGTRIKNEWAPIARRVFP